MEVSLVIPARDARSTLPTTLVQAGRFLADRFGSSFEILVVANERDSRRTEALARDYEAIIRGASPDQALGTRVIRARRAGKGAAIVSGIREARGEWIAFTDADLPYDLAFLDEAKRSIECGFALVAGSRALGGRRRAGALGSRFRRALGAGFNLAARAALPVRSRDTQAGIKAMSRELASALTQEPIAAGFAWDLELYCRARERGLPIRELAVTERPGGTTTVSFPGAAVDGLSSILRLRRVFSPREPGWDLPGSPSLGLLGNAYLRARWRQTPYREIAALLPRRGRIADLGCGHGLLAAALALGSTAREVLGVDRDRRRIEAARSRFQGNRDVRFEERDLRSADTIARIEGFDGVAIIDALHYLEPRKQEALILGAWRALRPGGRLVFREIDGARAGLGHRAYERLAVACGFTRGEAVHLRPGVEWKALALSAGFDVAEADQESGVFSDVVFACRKAGERLAGRPA